MKEGDNSENRIRLAIVTNIPAPYRVNVYNKIAQERGIDLLVIYGARKEPDRAWDLPTMSYRHIFLENKIYQYSGRFVHLGAGALKELVQFNPDAVITTGFNPLHLKAFWFAYRNNKKHLFMSDATLASERKLSALHVKIRKFVFNRSSNFIAATNSGVDLFTRQYGVDSSLVYRSPLIINSDVDWSDPKNNIRDIDILFSGRMTHIKNPKFAIEVAQQVAIRLNRRVNMAMLGDGVLLDEVRNYANSIAPDVNIEFPGNVAQSEIPGFFFRSKVFLFPTLWDPWGVVVNEAFAAAVPVISTAYAGAANELVVDGFTGYVLDLDLNAWVDATVKLLSNSELWQQMSAASKNAVEPYNDFTASYGVVDAVRASVLGAESFERLNTFPLINIFPPGRVLLKHAVTIVQRRLTHYRVPLFKLMKSKLEYEGVKLRVIYGNPTEVEKLKHDSGFLEWGEYVPVRYFFNDKFALQFGLGELLKKEDLIIVTQENKLINNLYFLSRRLYLKVKLAFWGHGRNMQANTFGFLEKFKRWTTNKVDWWFAYTEISKEIILSSKYPEERITVLNNSIDTLELKSQLDVAKANSRVALRESFGLKAGLVGIYVGSLYDEKRIDWILKAGEKLWNFDHSFQLVIVGDGVDAGLVKEFSLRHDWLKYLGVLHGQNKASILACSDFFMNPGLVGLAVVDAFVAGLPVLTSQYKKHSPEISYIKHGVNGLVSADDIDSYISVCAQLMNHSGLLSKLSAGALSSCDQYSIENMANNFVNGIKSALYSKPVSKIHGRLGQQISLLAILLTVFLIIISISD